MSTEIILATDQLQNFKNSPPVIIRVHTSVFQFSIMIFNNDYLLLCVFFSHMSYFIFCKKSGFIYNYFLWLRHFS